MPEVRLSWDIDREGRPKDVALEQHNVLNEGGTWPMKLRVFALPESGPPRSTDVFLRREGKSVVAIVDSVHIGCVLPDADDEVLWRLPLYGDARRVVTGA